MTRNATFLFQSPCQNFHSSESFWTSVFALHILSTAHRASSATMPAYQFCRNGGSWCFKLDGCFEVPKGLKLNDVVVEGKLSQKTLAPLGEEIEIPQDLSNLKPDVLVLDKSSKSIVVVEVKTIGSSLGRYQKEQYEKFVKHIEGKGGKAQLYFLISCGHEVEKDFEILEWKENEPKPNSKILLWEDVLKNIDAEDQALRQCLGPIIGEYAKADLSGNNK